MSELEGLVRLGLLLDSQPECMVSAAYELLKVRDRQGRTVRLKANAAQQAFEAGHGRENIVLKARQMGMSTWVAARFFLRTITHPGTLTLQVAHNREAAEAMLALVRGMWAELPESLTEGPLRLHRSNAGQMVFGEIGSEFRVASAADANAGRGLSVQNLHCSEVSRWPRDAGQTLAGLRAALAPGGELVLESTPSGAYGAFYEAWLQGVDACPARHADAKQDRETAMVRHFLPWWLEPSYTAAAVAEESWTDEERLLAEEHKLHGGQIGFRRGLEARYGALRTQEFAEDAESCFRETGSCCFEISSLETRLLEVPEAAAQRRRGALQVWLPPLPGRQYLLAVDTAGGQADGDFAAVQVLEMSTGLQCAELQERLRPAELARVCAELGREYGDALMVVERNNHGSAVLAYLQTEQGYARVYEQNGQQGWLTTAASKPEVVARMGALLLHSPERFMSRRLLRECRSFVTDGKGRAGATAGAHDDLVMAMAMGQAVRAELLLRA